MTDTSNEKLVGALVNGLAVLRYLQKAKSGVRVTQLARDLGLNPSTCFNLLRTLVHEGLAGFDPQSKTYTISIGVVSLAQGALDRENHIRVLHPELQRIALKFDVAMNLWQTVDKNRVLLVDRAEPISAVQISMRVGQRLPMFVGALGRCFAAHSPLPKSKIERRFKAARFARPIEFDEWYNDVLQVRERGFAVDEGYFSLGITTVAITIANGINPPFLAVSAIGISAQIDAEKLNNLSQEMLAISKMATRQI
ncbi:IclR family transcriptional regulator [Profundibacter sp.]